MTNPLDNVPLNTKMVYVMATTPSGCEIYMPVDSSDVDVVNTTKQQLQSHLNTAYPIQPQPPQLA